MPAIATRACLACKRELIVKTTGKNGRNYSCPHCDLSCYAKDGTEALKILSQTDKMYAPAGGEQQPPKPPADDKKKSGALPWVK